MNSIINELEFLIDQEVVREIIQCPWGTTWWCSKPLPNTHYCVVFTFSLELYRNVRLSGALGSLNNFRNHYYKFSSDEVKDIIIN